MDVWKRLAAFPESSGSKVLWFDVSSGGQDESETELGSSQIVSLSGD